MAARRKRATSRPPGAARRAQAALVAEALKSGAVSYVPKPVDLRYLHHIVAAAVDSSSRVPRR